MASSSHPPEVTKPSSPEVSLRVASCNLRADLDLNKFDSSLHIMIEFLKSHPIHKPLTKSTEFPLSIIHMAYSTAVYNSKEEYIEFDVKEDKTKKLCKNEFLKIIGLPESKKEKTFYEPTNEELFDVLDEMGYLPPRLEKPTNFKKGKLPAMWQFLVHIILRCLTGKVGGMDQMNRPFLVLLFGIYTGKEVDFGTTIWKDFASYIYPKKKEIPCGRFWGLVLQKEYRKLGLTKLKVPLPEGEEMFTPRVFSKYNISDKSDFAKAARLPEAMLQYIDENSEVLIKHREDTSPPEPIRPIRVGLIGDTSIPICIKKTGLKEKKTPGRGTKRKGEAISSPQGKKQLTQTILNFPKINDVEKRATVESEPHKEEEMVGTAAKLLEQAMSSFVFLTKEVREELKKKAVEKEKQKREKEEDMVDGPSEAMEEDFVFTADEGLIRDSVSPKSVKVKPSESKIFLLTSDTESDDVKKVPKGNSKTLPTASTSRRRTKVKKKNPNYVSRVEFDSLNQKLSEVLDVVKKIPPSGENFVSKEDFVEMKKIVTSLVQTVPGLETREKNLRESIVKSTTDALREMEDKRTDDTFKYLNRMDDMVKMVKEIQQSYEDLATTLGEKHRNEIIRVNEQLCDYRNKNIILQAVLVKVIQSANQLQKPRKVKFDEVLVAIQKVQNSVDALPKSLSNDEIINQAQQSFSKLFEMIQDLKGPRPVDKDEAGPSTKVREDEKVVINETSNEPQPPTNITVSHTKDEIPSEEEKGDLTDSVDVIRQINDDELVPKQTFSRPSSDEYQWDIPMSPNAQYYPVFQPLHPHLEKLFKTHAQPSNKVWSLRKIIRVLGYKKMSFENKEYFTFKVIRSDNKEYHFSEADFPNMNPNDLYLIGRHFRNTLFEKPSRSPFVRITKFLRSLIYDLGSVDAEVFGNFVHDRLGEIDQCLEGIEERHRGPTEDPELGIIYSNERDSPRLFFRLRQKHLCKTEFLEEMIGLTLRSRKASEGLKGKIIEEIEWWVAVRKWIKKVMDLVMNDN